MSGNGRTPREAPLHTHRPLIDPRIRFPGSVNACVGVRGRGTLESFPQIFLRSQRRRVRV